MKEGIQVDLEKIGSYGCYFLTLLKVGKAPTYLIHEYYKAFLADGYIDEDCTVLRPDMILKTLTGHKYRVVKTTDAYQFDSSADIIIGYFYNPKTKYHHFVQLDSNKNVIWDSLGNSKTVRDGYVESYRLFYEEM